MQTADRHGSSVPHASRNRHSDHRNCSSGDGCRRRRRKSFRQRGSICQRHVDRNLPGTFRFSGIIPLWADHLCSTSLWIQQNLRSKVFLYHFHSCSHRCFFGRDRQVCFAVHESGTWSRICGWNAGGCIDQLSLCEDTASDSYANEVSYFCILLLCCRNPDSCVQLFTVKVPDSSQVQKH